MRPDSLLRILAATLLLLTAIPSAASAADRQPLLMEGKKTLFQRVLSRPDAKLSKEAGAPAAGKAVPTFTVYHVFGRRTVDGQEWLEVGQPRTGPAEGWLPARQTIDWKQTLLVSFTNPAGRDRTLFFKERGPMIDLLESEDLVRRSDRLRTEAATGRLPPDSPVVSIEPAEHVDIFKRFYLLPILETETVMLESGFETRAMKVASVPLKTDPLPRKPSQEEILAGFNVGIVFVIDTTQSMGPYIDRTRDAVERIFKRVSGSDIGERVSFGMVGFRDDTGGVPELGYVSRVFAPLALPPDPEGFRRRVATMEAATVSSRGFNEDSLAGVKAAVDLPNWERFGGRYIVLVTDAGARTGSDPLSATRMNPEQINQKAAQNHTAIYTLHLKTPDGKRTHAMAAAQYRALSRFEGVPPLYYGVESGSVEAFGKAVDGLADQLIGQVQDTIRGKLTEAAPPDATPEERARTVGRAMQLAYLGRAEGTSVPSVFEAWTVDRDLKDPARTNLEVRALITKNQLSDLRDVLNAVMTAGRETRLAPDAFFRQLRSAVAHLARDPSRLGMRDFADLGDLMGEFIGDLPYRSRILQLDEAAWIAAGPSQQREILDDIESKLALYREWDSTPALWVSLYDGAPAAETVFPIPLEALP